MKEKIAIRHKTNINIVILEYVLEFLDSLYLPKDYKLILKELNKKIWKDYSKIPKEVINNYDSIGEKWEVTTYFKKKET